MTGSPDKFFGYITAIGQKRRFPHNPVGIDGHYVFGQGSNALRQSLLMILNESLGMGFNPGKPLFDKGQPTIDIRRQPFSLMKTHRHQIGKRLGQTGFNDLPVIIITAIGLNRPDNIAHCQQMVQGDFLPQTQMTL